MSFKVSVIKKNQLLAWLLTFILCVAWFINYANDPRRNFDVEVTGKIEDGLDEAVLVNSPSLVSNVDDYLDEISKTDKLTTASEYFGNSRIERNNAFADRIEIYERMLENTSISDEQKAMAADEIKNINNQKNAISIAENLIKLKGFKDVVIMLNDDSVNVVVAEEELNDAKVAQIQNIVQNELKCKIEDIHINNL